MKTLLNRVGWWVMLLLAAFITLYAWTFLLLPPEVVSPEIRARFLAVPWAGLSHVIGGGIALILGPFQLSKKFRKRSLPAHRWLGRLYLLGVLAAGFAGLYLASVTLGGFPARMGFGFLAVFWLFSGTMAYISIRQGDKKRHRQWMIRNYALTYAAVALRVLLPIFMANMDFETAYQAVAWMCWVPNLVLAEWVFLRHR